MPDQRRPIVEFRGVSFEIDGVRILNEIDLKIESGEVVVLLGESGCGKTTTLRLINRLIEPTSGNVLVEGRPTTDWDPIELRRKTGYVLQDGGLFPHMTAAENVGIILRLEHWSEEKKKARVDELFELVGLATERFADRFPHELSGGQRQRIGVARALAADPGLLLLDEPFGALDPLTRTKLQKEFASIVLRMGKTAVFVTHDLHEAMLLGTRIVLMEKGQIVLNAEPADFEASEIPLVRAYLETI
ncbi:MAG TPA: ATP-binding cassette domain-containing protein [Pyrinomonadaceae bacterium]|nr:ATP-binding cassette domain-containing protein [Chloracidobacterium sp.]HRJ89210.1 ATP-binding cassette domain-containing protein [Pyrinomonadaceae bacterium]HRK50994.1 ATP-binding cassette domain-containing protein [Pyrinomonadaceae bacterium]